jgi:hypothetical protein
LYGSEQQADRQALQQTVLCLHELGIDILTDFGRLQWHFVFELPVLQKVFL